MKRRLHRHDASTLMLVLWALLLISAVLLGWIAVSSHRIDALQEANRGLEARAMAHSGMAVALHPGVGPESPFLEQEVTPGQGYRVTIRSEGGRLNVNYWLVGGDPGKIAFFKQYLRARGLTLRECEVLTDCLLDWVSPARGTRRPNSVPIGPAYQPPHRPLRTIEEIALVAGSEPLVSRAGWKDDLTLYSSGVLDIESAPAHLLALLPGVGEARAQRFVELREELRTRSTHPGGYPFQNLAEALSYLGMTQEQFARLSTLAGFRDPVQRVQSVGESRQVIRQVDAIVRKQPGSKPQILFWQEP